MRALLLAAGFGTRLGSLTASMPKPMLPIEGRPVLEYLLRHLQSHGVSDVAINLHFMAEAVIRQFGAGESLGMRIRYSYETAPLGTAGALRPLAEFLREGSAFLVQYGDVLTDEDFTAMAGFHREREALATILVHRRPGSNSVVDFDAAGHVSAFLERPSDAERTGLESPWVNSGVCICDPAVLDLVPAETPCDLPRDVFPVILRSRRLFAYPLTGYRCAIDSPTRYEEAAQAVASGRCKSFMR